jgi:hypothetical protein
MGRPPIFKKPMTAAQYKRRYRRKLKAKALDAKRELRRQAAEQRRSAREAAAKPSQGR